MSSAGLDQLATQLHESGIPPKFDAATSVLLIATWREVVKGRPISRTRIHEIADQLHLAHDFATDTLNRISEFDDEGNLVGVVGLSQKDYSHKFHINGDVLSTWCAWDALFLPQMLNQSVYIESPSPSSKETIRITISEDGVEQITPDQAAISFVVPEPLQDGVNAVEEVWTNMCSHIHFFSSESEAESWLEERGVKGTTLSIEAGYELGRRTFADLLKHVSDETQAQ